MSQGVYSTNPIRLRLHRETRFSVYSRLHMFIMLLNKVSTPLLYCNHPLSQTCEHYDRSAVCPFDCRNSVIFNSRSGGKIDTCLSQGLEIEHEKVHSKIKDLKTSQSKNLSDQSQVSRTIILIRGRLPWAVAEWEQTSCSLRNPKTTISQ